MREQAIAGVLERPVGDFARQHTRKPFAHSSRASSSAMPMHGPGHRQIECHARGFAQELTEQEEPETEYHLRPLSDP